MGENRFLKVKSKKLTIRKSVQSTKFHTQMRRGILNAERAIPIFKCVEYYVGGFSDEMEIKNCYAEQTVTKKGNRA